MKSAKEMFENLGFEQEFNIACVNYYNKEKDRYIWFFQDTETIEIIFDIDMRTLQAINQQINELGWNDTTVNFDVKLDGKKVMEIMRDGNRKD